MFEKLVSWPAVAFVLGVAVLIAFMGYRETSEMTRLSEHGRKAMAQIEEVHWTTRRGIDSNYTLDVTFEPEGGKAVHEEVSVDNDIGEQARNDESFTELEVSYLPDDTSVVRPADAEDGSTRMYVVAGAMAALAALLAMLRLRQGYAAGG
ncbi:DUF3592 domain-containing protein [Lysobacter panacisoli]|nr:DUF3592 domain-containing protein [Lysobacter panacisoli]